MAYLIQAINDEPRWMTYVSEDGWAEHASQLGAIVLPCGSTRGLLAPVTWVIWKSRCWLW